MLLYKTVTFDIVEKEILMGRNENRLKLAIWVKNKHLKYYCSLWITVDSRQPKRSRNPQKRSSYW